MKPNAVLVSTLQILICISFSTSTELSKESVKYCANLYKEIAKAEKSSFMISPVSLKIALGMLASGAKGGTQKELLRAVGANSDKEISEVAKKVTLNTLSSANKIYISKKFEINPTYIKGLVDNFKSEVQNLDFGNSGQAANEINKWVGEKTRQKIKELVTPENIKSDTAAMVINALYFQDQWLYKFSKKDTRKKDFYVSPTKNTTVDMMNLDTIITKNADNEKLNAKFVRLPYVNEKVAMYIALPNTKGDIKNLEKRIEEVLSTKVTAESKILISIPKFTFQNSFTLNSALEKMGVKSAFTNADFSGILKSKQNMQLNIVKQATYIKVDEKGTTAAAVTGAGPGVLSGFKDHFYADHPFIFYITFNNEVLFLGRFQPL